MQLGNFNVWYVSAIADQIGVGLVKTKYRLTQHQYRSAFSVKVSQLPQDGINTEFL